MYFFTVVAGVLALYFAAAAVRRPRPAALLATVLWAAYAVYEYFVANGTLCDPGCNIRVDLLLFLPLLGWATYLALSGRSNTSSVAVLAVVCLLLVAGLGSAFGNNTIAVVAGLAAVALAALAIRSRYLDRRM